MHGLAALFLEVIALAIILLFVGYAALRVLILATRMIMASIALMTIVRLVIVAITSVDSMVVAILVVTMLLVAQVTAMCGRKLSHIFSFGCFLFMAIFSRSPATFLAT